MFYLISNLHFCSVFSILLFLFCGRMVKMDIKTLIDNLKLATKTNTQKELAEYFGWPKSNISAWISRNAVGALVDNLIAAEREDLIRHIFSNNAKANSEVEKLFEENEIVYGLFIDFLDNAESKAIEFLVEQEYQRQENWFLNEETPDEKDYFFRIVDLIHKIKNLKKESVSKNEIRNLELQLKELRLSAKKDIEENYEVSIRKFLRSLKKIMASTAVQTQDKDIGLINH